MRTPSERMPYLLTALLLLPSGFLLAAIWPYSSTNIFHELSHAIVGSFFGKVEQITMTYVVIDYATYSPFIGLLVRYAGYIGEAWMMTGLFILLTSVLKSAWGWFFFGAVNGLPWYLLFNASAGGYTGEWMRPDIHNLADWIIIMAAVCAAVYLCWRTAIRVWRRQLHPPDPRPVFNYFSKKPEI
jgi:hypothetical protein